MSRDRPTVAFVSTTFPYPSDNGKKVVLAGFLRFLMDALGVRNVTYVMLGSLEQDRGDCLQTIAVPLGPAWKRLLSVAWHSLVMRRKSLQESFLYTQAARDRLRECIARLDPDIVIMDTIRIGQFFEDAIARAPGRRWVLYMEDLFSRRYRGLLKALGRRDRAAPDPLGAFAFAIPAPLRAFARPAAVQVLLYRLEESLVADSERRLADAVGEVCLVNGDEVSRLAERAPRARIWETPPYLAAPGLRRDSDACRKGPFLILGALDYPPNAMAVGDFLAEAMPAIARTMPDARIKIVGKRAPRTLSLLCAVWSPHVELVGYVPDLASLMASAAAMIVPVKVGSGPKLKSLEALAHGLPLITTRNGVEAIPVEPNVHCFVSDDLSEFPAFMQRLQCPDLNAAFSARCRELFESQYAREAIYRRYAAAFLGRG